MKRLLAFLLLLSACRFSMNAQNDKWDAALNQYQQISYECIRLRTRSAAGERIPAAEISTLLTQVTVLRKTLQDAGGQMTPAQRLRFKAIRLRYDEAFGVKHFEPIARLSSSSSLIASASPLAGAALTPSSYSDYFSTNLKTSATLQEPAVAASEHISPGVLLYCGFPVIAPGAMMLLSYGRFGGFISGSISIPYTIADYSCFSDGTTKDGGYIWTNSKENVSRWSATAGATFSPWNFLTLYAGAGYGSRALLWQDVSDRWASVSDRSKTGLCLDGGLIFNIGVFSLLAGVSTIGFDTPAAQFGLGCRF